MNDHVGRKLGNYQLIRQLGHGGFGEVYLAEHMHLKTQAAIKLLQQVQLPSDEEEKFREEAKTIAKFDHPHIIRVIDYGIQDSTSTPYLVMDYAPNGNVRNRYPRGKILEPLHILSYVIQVADALQYTHDLRVIHRDVKPENMLLDKQNHILLSDFGIAVVYETTSSSNTVDTLGTPAYMAPEQFQGRSFPASDQYSLGVVVYEWLCGTLPFIGGIGELMHQHGHFLPPSMCEKVPFLSQSIEEVIQKALAKKPNERYASVKDFAQAFQKACQIKDAGNGTQRTIVMSSSHSALPGLTKRVRPNVVTPPDDSSVTWNVPYHRNMFFAGRDTVLTSIHDTFCSQKRTTQTQALSGLGGIGKTQIAIEYVYRYYSEYRYIFWVRGDTREKMLSDFASLATTLDLKEQHEQDQQLLIEAVRSCLRKNSHWLLVIDNIEDLRNARTILPSSARGHILITTRTQTTGNIAKHIDLEKMALDEGALFLLRRTKILAQDDSLQEASTDKQRSAKDIADTLDGLPLALDQAGGYIEESGCNLSDYLSRYQSGRMKLLRKRGSFDFDHPASITETFSYSLEKIDKISPTAVELLRFCAFLHPDAIPEELIINGANELGPILQPVASDPFLLDEILVILRKFSIVRRNSNTNTLSIHRLVQAVLQDGMNEKTRRSWVERTVRAVNLALPDINDFSMWQHCQLYMPHVQKSVALVEEWKIVSPEAARLLELTGMYLLVQAQFTQALDHFELASDMHKQLAVSEPAIAIASQIYLFRHYYYQGKYVLAEPHILEALRLIEQMPDSEPLAKATCFEAIALLSYQQGKYSHAEDYFLKALIMFEQCTGIKHPLVVCIYCGLGNVNLALAKYDLAEKSFQVALDIWQQMPKPQHPFMSTSLNGLGRLFIERGKYGQAELYLQQERAHLEQTLQPLHPTLARNLNDFALLCIAQGKYILAETLLKQSLKILEQSDSLHHPFAGYTLNALGRLSYLNRKYPTAEHLIQKAQNILEQALGCEHPDVLTTINNLADVYVEQNNLNMAEELYKEVVLAKRIQIFGTEHPSVAQTFHSLAHLVEFRGRAYYEQSVELYNKARIIREEVLGPEHPAVAQSLYSLADIYYRRWQKFEQAEPLFQEAIAIYEKAQLLDHPELAHILRSYAPFYFQPSIGMLKRKNTQHVPKLYVQNRLITEFSNSCVGQVLSRTHFSSLLLTPLYTLLDRLQHHARHKEIGGEQHWPGHHPEHFRLIAGSCAYDQPRHALLFLFEDKHPTKLSA
jgi:serine/threonine protein kinase/tetratricopeptide (TPR) repeat protein